MTRHSALRFCMLTLALGAGAALAACGETTNTSPSQLTFDRPVDIAFACYGGMRFTEGGTATAAQEVGISAMPTRACDIRSQTRMTGEPVPVPAGQEDLSAMGGEQLGAVSWYGLILESGPGTVAISQFSTKPSTQFSGGDVSVLDADLLTPGKNSISVGEEPVAIVTDRQGCHAITANAGSCDLSVLDIGSALDTSPAVRVDRLAVTSQDGTPILARPAAMVTGPSADEIGFTCPARPTGIVYVAYPGCHLVAAVKADTGQIVGGIQYDSAGVPSLVTGPVSCSAECGAGGPRTPGVRPVALDLEEDPRTGTRRLVIGADNSASIAIVELDQDLLPLSVSQIAFEDPVGDLGITAVALSPEIGMGGRGAEVDDEGPGGDFQFVYAVATDGTVRVADVLTIRKECDTQIDPRFARGVRLVRDLSCFPVGDPGNPPRRPGRGSGIALPGSAIPMSVDFVRSDGIAGDARADEDPRKLVGYFAIVLASDGTSYIVNVDDDNYPDVFNLGAPLAVPASKAMPHQLRDAVESRPLSIAEEEYDDEGCDFTGPVDTQANPLGGPRVSGVPSRNAPSGTVASVKLTQLPGFRQVRCERGEDTSREVRAVSEMGFVVPDALRATVFPDPSDLAYEENWTFAWEGAYSTHESLIRIDNRGMRIIDGARPFCAAGAEQYDWVQLRGCDPSIGNADCPVGYSCYVHPDSQIQGLGACMKSDEADRFAGACRDYLTSLRRYTVKRAASGELELLPRRVELRTTPLDGCTSDAQCEALGDYAAKFSSSAQPSQDTTAADSRTWACVADPTRAPLGGTGKRCQMRCNATSDCATGTVCQGAVAGQPMSGFCMEGVIPSQSCVNAPQRFELRVGEAFAVTGNRTGFVHPVVEGTDGTCERSPFAPPRFAGRLPLEPKDPAAPDTLRACDPTADPVTGALPGGGYEPNPCSTTVAHTEALPQYTPGTCELASTEARIVERQAPAVRFRNLGMNLTLVDPYYPGDQTCITDRAANLGKIPHVVPGYSVTFRQVAGGLPRVLPFGTSTPSFPVKVVRGPTNSIWVIDEGDFLSTSSSQASTRGKVFRVEPGSFLINVLE